MGEQNANPEKKPLVVEIVPDDGGPPIPLSQLHTAAALNPVGQVARAVQAARIATPPDFNLQAVMARTIADAMRMVAQPREMMPELRAVAMPIPDYRQEERKQKRREKVYASRVDEFCLWAYSDRAERRGDFDAFPVRKGDGRDVCGIMYETIKLGYFEFASATRPLLIPDDHIEEAARRTVQTRKGHGYPVRFTNAGLAYAKALWWANHWGGTLWAFWHRNREAWAADWVSQLIMCAAMAGGGSLITALWLTSGKDDAPPAPTPAPQVAPDLTPAPPPHTD